MGIKKFKSSNEEIKSIEYKRIKDNALSTLNKKLSKEELITVEDYLSKLKRGSKELINELIILMDIFNLDSLPFLRKYKDECIHILQYTAK
jgi:hypothetical protein